MLHSLLYIIVKLYTTMSSRICRLSFTVRSVQTIAAFCSLKVTLSVTGFLPVHLIPVCFDLS